MFSIRSGWQKFPGELVGPSVMFLHKEMNVNEVRAPWPDHFN